RVPGLTSDRGCAGDIVGDRLVFQYGSAAGTAGLLAASQRDLQVDLLEQFARRIACLGAGQLDVVERTLAIGFVEVAARMKQHGMLDLVPAFARLVAPLQLLILDAEKHRGEGSFASHWFRRCGGGVVSVIAQAGWPSGNVYLWNRLQARLVGFPRCPPGTVAPDCVDLERFVQSLRDPRALGLGGCALAGMLANGLVSIGND